MLLSDAISLGSLLRPKAVGVFFNRHGESCAMGAAAEATGFVPQVTDSGFLVNSGECIKHLETTFPYAYPGGFIGSIQNLEMPLGVRAAKMNNSGASREEVAAWVRKQEIAMGICDAEGKEIIAGAPTEPQVSSQHQPEEAAVTVQ